MSGTRALVRALALSCALTIPLGAVPALGQGRGAARDAGAPVLGMPLAMAAADDTDVSKAIASNFVRPMMRLPEGEPVDFAWARVDLDGDGYDELALSLRGKDRCGVDGCPFLVMRRKADGAWKPVMATVARDVSVMGDPPRRSRALVVRTSHGEETWSWDDATAMMVRRAD